jgi:predicted CXXCH cytochrome family protein
VHPPPDQLQPNEKRRRDHGAKHLRELLPSLFCLLCALAVFVGCTTEKKQRWLTFFFDGVPGPGDATNRTAVVYDENGRPLDRTPAAPTSTAAAAKPKFVAHPPYEDHKCNECHESRFSVKMKGTQRQVCFACHEDFLEKAKVRHQPAENTRMVQPIRKWCC